jgi:hypothetical protein
MIPQPDTENHLCHVCGDYGTLWENGKWTCGECRGAKPAHTEARTRLWTKIETEIRPTTTSRL